MYELWEKLEELKKYRWIELSHPLNNHSPYWAGIPEGAVELGKTAYDWGNELECLIQTFKFPGQFGTHIDSGTLCEGGAAQPAVYRAEHGISSRGDRCVREGEGRCALCSYRGGY